MSDYGVFVWSSYGIVMIALIGLLISSITATRKIQSQLKQSAKYK